MSSELTKHQDQSLVVSGTNVDLFGVVDQIVASSVQERDPHVAFNAAATLRKWGKISGLVLAKLLYEVKSAWEVYETDDDFVDMAEAEGDVDKQTARKYTSVWENVILGCPQHLRSRFEVMSVETLWLVAPAASDGNLDADAWEKLSKCTSKHEVRDIIREIRGKRTSSANALILTLKRDGTLMCRRGDEIDFFGFLNVEKDSKLVRDAIDRFIRGTGAVEE